MSEPTVPTLLDIIGGLMFAENMGDVHDEIIRLCRVAGIPEPEGNFEDGWTDDDLIRVGLEPEEETDE